MDNSVYEEICRIKHKLNECIEKINSLELAQGPHGGSVPVGSRGETGPQGPPSSCGS